MADDLKQQFQLLQEHKKQKLLRKNEARAANAKRNKGIEEEQNGRTAKIMENDKASTFDEIDDNLNLELTPFGDGITLSDSEENDLKDTIRELRDENGRLYKLLGEKEEEMKIFKRRWQNEKKDLTGQNIGSENVAQKIIELSKKNREMTAELESSKTKCRQLQSVVQKLETELQQNILKPKEVPQHPNPVTENGKMETKMGELEAKVSQLNAKVTDYRNQIDLQKKELKIAHKVLSKEIGEDVNIQSLLTSETTWRGRQQQIVNLQNKVSELQRKLSQATRPSSSRSTNMSVMSSVSYQSPLAMSMHDEKIRSTIKKIEQERKDNQQRLQTELDVLHKDHARLKEKHDAAKSRIHVLSSDLKNIKTQLATMVDKGKHDDDLISALMREQEYLKTLNAKLSKEKEEIESNSNSRVVKAKQDLDINIELTKQIEQQERKVKELEEEIQNLKLSKSRDKQGRDAEGLEQRPMSKPKPSLIPTPPTSADRRNGFNRFKRMTSASSDTNATRTQLQEMKTSLQATEVERDRLTELVGLLQKRIDGITEESISSENKVIEMKRTNAKLEKHIERLRVTLNNKTQTNGHKNRPSSRSNKNGLKERAVEDMYQEIEELQARLEIQTDENDALKEALESTLKAKDEDMKIYQEMVEQTKFIYLQGLKQIKQASTSS